jgi:hypothetical protein
MKDTVQTGSLPPPRRRRRPRAHRLPGSGVVVVIVIVVVFATSVASRFGVDAASLASVFYSVAAVAGALGAGVAVKQLRRRA